MGDRMFSVKKTFEIAKDGQKIVLTEDEMKELLQQDEVQKLIAGMTLPAMEIANVTVDGGTVGDVEQMMISSSSLLFPPGFKKSFETNSDPKASRKATFFYAFNPISQEYGFKIISLGGRQSSFHKVGSISDANTILGRFIRALPATPAPIIKRDFLLLSIKKVTEGRRLKALIDIAEHEGYLRKVDDPYRKGRLAYLRTDKINELGGDSARPM